MFCADGVMVIVYVDDFLVMAENDKTLIILKKDLSKTSPINHMGVATEYLRMKLIDT